MQSVQATTADTALEEEGREFLTFRLGAEEYGIDILRVNEIRGWEVPTAIAGTPDFIKGVINLRGTIVPIIDMRLKFRLGSAQYNNFTVTIILRVARRVIGIVVDAVSDVITLAPHQMRPAPDFQRLANGVEDADALRAHVCGVDAAIARSHLAHSNKRVRVNPRAGRAAQQT